MAMCARRSFSSIGLTKDSLQRIRLVPLRETTLNSTELVVNVVHRQQVQQPSIGSFDSDMLSALHQ